MSNHSDSDSRQSILFTDDNDARHKFDIYKSKDPFPEITPALLNSADIYDYVAVTGMVAPFYTKDLKSASYEIRILGTVIYWDENGEKNFLDITQGKEFTLRRNSIAFVTPEPKFRLPDYIALRFNLRITHVHRGILLGTGPLVDPGFEGKLLIPLHNLITNDYKFKGGDPLIWVEFTKLSPNEKWEDREVRNHSVRVGKYEPFSDNKKDLTAEYYLAKASPHSPIRSSIPDTLESARRSAQEAEKKAKSIARNVTWAGVGSVVALVVSLSFGLYQVVSLIQDSNGYVKGARSELHTFQREFDQQREFLNSKSEKVQLLEREIQELKKQVNDLSKSLDEYKVSREEQAQENVPDQ